MAEKIGAEQAVPIIHALEKLDREQKIEVKRDLLMELATKADIARLEGEIKRVEIDLKGEIKRLELFMKVLIGLAIIGMAFFSPNAAELIRLLK
jgi:hypothetical protein